MNFKSTGGWSTLGTKRFAITLNKGVNVLRVYNNDGYSSDIDYVKIVKLGFEEEPEPEVPEDPQNPGGDDPGQGDNNEPGQGDNNEPGQDDNSEPVYFENGTYTDWSGVDALYKNDSQKVWIKDDAEYIYFATGFSYDNLEHWQVMVEADGNASTGMTSPWPFAPGGIDYMVEGDLNGGSLAYKNSSDGDWSWDYNISVENPVDSTVSTDAKIIEVRIKKAALTNQDRPLSDNIGFGFRYIDSGWGELGSTNSAQILSYTLTAPGQ